MAKKELVIRETLSDQMIEAGEKLVQYLDDLNAQVQGAFWLYLDEEKTWRMMVISPLVETKGPKLLYAHIIDIYKKVADEEKIISLHDITVSSTANTLFKLLKKAVSTHENISSGIRFSKNAINGTFIEDAYIYRI